MQDIAGRRIKGLHLIVSGTDTACPSAKRSSQEVNTGGGRCHNLKNGKEAKEEGKSYAEESPAGCVEDGK